MVPKWVITRGRAYVHGARPAPPAGGRGCRFGLARHPRPGCRPWLGLGRRPPARPPCSVKIHRAPRFRLTRGISGRLTPHALKLAWLRPGPTPHARRASPQGTPLMVGTHLVSPEMTQEIPFLPPPGPWAAWSRGRSGPRPYSLGLVRGERIQPF